MIKLLATTIVTLFAAAPAALILFAALFNWKIIKNKPLKQNLQELGCAAASSVASLFIAITTRPFTCLDKLPLPEKNGDTLPILMVHGLYHNKAAWFIMKYRLSMQGFSNLNTWQYNSFTTSYPELVLELRREILKLQKKQNRKVMLIGHSLGGLLISGAASDPEIEKLTAGIITIATPFKGSMLAVTAPGRLGKSLHPQSALFISENKIHFPEHIRKTAIISPTDEMVLPWENLEPDHEQWTIKRSPALGHVAMLYSRRVARIVAETIREIKNESAA
ncbi:esterase/lipase family protein [Maridesulfovibrio hydrothermalis]|uniref:PGAP1 family protein n=1 Tax=Maridesulfovibrio hydrothermalis AM13 = DSM 14728 TaxID=1121451 RepID=L0R8W1_9BACT|nr:PGAP1 family protein [Maridesulfovibrio hydrothermalis]CCO22620.1 PGAP1 family protein [Maridesulfovibrio hydrothermalis AM13 = DSM 14728]